VRTLRRLTILTLAAALAAAAALAWRAPSWTAELVERRLSAVAGRAVEVGSVRYALFPIRVEVRDLRIAGPKPGDAPFLEAPLVVAAPSLRPLADRRLDLYELRVVGPRIRVRAYEEGGDDIPRLRLGERGSAEMRVRRLVVERGELWLDHRRVPLDLDLPAFEGRLVQRGPGVLAGRLSIGPGDARFGAAPPIPLSTSMDLAVRDGLVSIETARLHGPKTDLVYRGQVRVLPSIRGDLELSGGIDLGVVDRHVLATGLDLDGAAHFQGWARIEGSRLRLGGRLSGTDGRFDGLDVARYSGDVAWDAGGVRLRTFSASFLGGSGVFDVDVPPPPSNAHVAAALRGVDAERMAAYLFDLGLPGLGARATGGIDVRWPRGRARALSGEAAIELEAAEDGRTPLAGRFAWRAKDGAQTIGEAALRTPSAEARASGRIDATGGADLDVHARTANLAESDALGLRVRRALHAAAPEAVGWTGAGTFEGKWRGTLGQPVFEGRFTGEDFGLLGVTWGRAEWSGAAEPGRIRMDRLVVRRDGGELRIAGWMQTGGPGEEDALDVTVRVHSWPARDFTRALAWDVDLEGPVSGQAVLRGRRSAPFGESALSSATGTYAGVAYEDLRLAATLRGPVTEVTNGSATLAGGRVTFRGAVTEDGAYDGEAAARDVDVAALAARAGIATPWRGRLSGRGVLVGTLDRPRVVARLEGAGLALGAEPVGALTADVRGGGDGAVAVEARVASERLEVGITGTVGVAAPWTADLSGAVRKAELDPFIRVLDPSFPQTIGVAAAAWGSLRGPLARPAEIVAAGELTNVDLRLPDYPVANRGPLALAVRDGRLAIESFHLAGEGTDLVVSGSAGLLAGGPLEVAVEGAADLRALALVSPELRGHGAARLAVRVGGTREAPAVAGTLDLDGDGIRVRGFPHGLEDVRGRITFDAGGAQWSGVTATLGGGSVELAGQAAHRGGHLLSFDVQAAGRGMGFRYPEGLKSTVDAELRLFGDAARQWLTGTVDVRQAVWTRRYDVASELLAASAPPAASGGPRMDGGVRFDVKVRAPGTLRIDNNLATLAARAELVLQGTHDAPVVLGRAEIDRGRVYFQGNTYVIRRGTIDFQNPHRTDPVFDVEAEARVRSYNVVLKTQGTLDRVTPTLSSDPPLSTVGILSLLAGADESEVERGADFRDRHDLAAAGAATLAAGRISEQFGLERRASRLGLSRFSIDPTVGVRGEYRNPGVRLTAGKRVTPDLSVVYSQDLRGTDEHLVSVEYSLSDTVSVLLTRAEPGGLGFDVRLRRSE
jgi:hypothetical protein